MKRQPQRERLRAAFEIQRVTRLERAEDELLDDAWFELNTWDSALAGIALQLLEGGMPAVDQLGPLGILIMSDSETLLLQDGKSVNLAEREDYLEFARLLVKVQSLCRDVLDARAAGFRWS